MSFQPQERGPPTLAGGLLESETELRELSAQFIFHCPSFQHAGLLVTSPALDFLCLLLPPWELSLSWAPALLGLLLAGGRIEVVSARLNPSHGTIDVRGVCHFLGSVSSQQKSEVMDVKALGASQLSDSVAAQFYLENKGKYILEV